MTWQDWKSLWGRECKTDGPRACVTVSTPYFYVRVLWHYNRRPFYGWPSVYETGVVWGVRWPFRRQFKEWKRISEQPLPMALYGPMDMAYLLRVYSEFSAPNGSNPQPVFTAAEFMKYKTAQAIKEIVQREPKCAHNYWIASCENCARKALLVAIEKGYIIREVESGVNLMVPEPQKSGFLKIIKMPHTKGLKLAEKESE